GGRELLEPALHGLLVDGLEGQVRGPPESVGERVHGGLRFRGGAGISRRADDERDGDEQHAQPLRSAPAAREPRRRRRRAWIGYKVSRPWRRCPPWKEPPRPPTLLRACSPASPPGARRSSSSTRRWCRSRRFAPRAYPPREASTAWCGRMIPTSSRRAPSSGSFPTRPRCSCSSSRKI